ncbi:hypothetical protein RA25_02815 [Leisingera sp. ANG-S5]|nr:hypothetical protein RA25_02815 [Leisingera sp. ANG-S5]
MPYCKRSQDPVLPFIDQDKRVCQNCEKRFLSGVAVIERGFPVRMLCMDCAHLHDERDWDEEVSK